MIDRTRIDRKIGEYGVAGANALSDPGLLPRVQEAKRILSSRMRPVGRDEIVKQIPPGDYHVSRKLDGVFEVLVLDEGEVFSVNPSGTVRVGLPLHAEAKQQLEAAGLTRALVVGEIYVTKDGRPGRLHDVLALARGVDHLRRAFQVVHDVVGDRAAVIEALVEDDALLADL